MSKLHVNVPEDLKNYLKAYAALNRMSIQDATKEAVAQWVAIQRKELETLATK